MLPWRTTANMYVRAHEKLRDVIVLYDGDTTFTIQHVVDAAREAAAELNQVHVSKVGGPTG